MYTICVQNKKSLNLANQSILKKNNLLSFKQISIPLGSGINVKKK